MSPTPRRRIVVAAALVILVVSAVGTGFAFWTAPGSGGNGAADTATTQPVTLTAGAPTAQLFPGGQASVWLTIANPNSSSVRVGSLALDTSQGTGGFAVDGAHAGCTLTTLSFATQTNAGAGWTVTAGGSLPITLASSLSMTLSAANACQGATFTIYLTATA